MLSNLLTTADKQGRDFRDHIRAYNSALAFASLGVNLDKELANARRGVYTFRIHGVVHHYIGQLTPREGEAPSFAQIYIHDGTAEGDLENRQRHLALILNQKATDRPDLIVRVFRMKLRELLTDICKHHVLGSPLAHVYTIEFQKRGLPNAHILIILAEHDNPEHQLTMITS